MGEKNPQKIVKIFPHLYLGPGKVPRLTKSFERYLGLHWSSQPILLKLSMIQDKNASCQPALKRQALILSEFGSMSVPTFHGKINIDLDTCYDLGCDRSSSEMEFEISNAVRRSVCSTKGTAAFAPGWTESFLIDDCPAFCLSVSIKTNSSCMKMAIECARGNETWTLPGLAKATKDRQGEGFKLQKKTHKFS